MEILTGYRAWTHTQILKHVVLNTDMSLLLQINLGLLIMSMAGFLLPGYLFYHRRNLTLAKAERDRLAASQSDKENAPLTQSDGRTANSQANGLAANGYTTNSIQ